MEKDHLRKKSNDNRKPNSIALIAHGYGDDESDNEDDLDSKRETKEKMPTEKKGIENVPEVVANNTIFHALFPCHSNKLSASLAHAMMPF